MIACVGVVPLVAMAQKRSPGGVDRGSLHPKPGEWPATRALIPGGEKFKKLDTTTVTFGVAFHPTIGVCDPCLSLGPCDDRSVDVRAKNGFAFGLGRRLGRAGNASRGVPSLLSQFSTFDSREARRCRSTQYPQTTSSHCACPAHAIASTAGGGGPNRFAP